MYVLFPPILGPAKTRLEKHAVVNGTDLLMIWNSLSPYGFSLRLPDTRDSVALTFDHFNVVGYEADVVLHFKERMSGILQDKVAAT